ncbi:hypothetical protein BY458DRAFT_515759 [Sporodiniella umbellata]|nr:hypothetical protein BY458DRAFT_515759 [Sporodiniella umbellata]
MVYVNDLLALLGAASDFDGLSRTVEIYSDTSNILLNCPETQNLSLTVAPLPDW